MDTKQKALAINALDTWGFSIRIRDSGEWYATCDTNIKRGSMLCSTMGNGATPDAAVDDLWTCLTDLKHDEYLVLHASDSERRMAVRWNGFMWDCVREKDAA